jgi:CheY-like chemotaxis protein
VIEEPTVSAHLPIRVLLVEDAPDQAYLMSATLEQHGGVQVTVAQDGVHALELAADPTFRLVITDLNLPGMDGFELTRELKRLRPDLPVIAVTGYDTPAHTEGARRAGADAILTKPVERGVLLAQLASSLPALAPAPSGGPPAVVAVGVGAEDLLLGCGGSLLAHLRAGHRVVVAVLAGNPAALRDLGVELVDLGESTNDALRALETLAPPAGTRLAYVPSPRDGDEVRRGLLEVCRAAFADVPQVMGYATVSTTLEFRPDRYRDVGEHLEAKLTALALVEPNGEGATPAFARAHAVYWGRLAGFAEVEPFETLRVLPNDPRDTP